MMPIISTICPHSPTHRAAEVGGEGSGALSHHCAATSISHGAVDILVGPPTHQKKIHSLSLFVPLVCFDRNTHHTTERSPYGASYGNLRPTSSAVGRLPISAGDLQNKSRYGQSLPWQDTGQAREAAAGGTWQLCWVH